MPHSALRPAVDLLLSATAMPITFSHTPAKDQAFLALCTDTSHCHCAWARTQPQRRVRDMVSHFGHFVERSRCTHDHAH